MKLNKQKDKKNMCILFTNFNHIGFFFSQYFYKNFTWKWFKENQNNLSFSLK